MPSAICWRFATIFDPHLVDQVHCVMDTHPFRHSRRCACECLPHRIEVVAQRCVSRQNQFVGPEPHLRLRTTEPRRGEIMSQAIAVSLDFAQWSTAYLRECCWMQWHVRFDLLVAGFCLGTAPFGARSIHPSVHPVIQGEACKNVSAFSLIRRFLPVYLSTAVLARAARIGADEQRQ